MKNKISKVTLIIVVTQCTITMLPDSFIIPAMPNSIPKGAVTNEYKIIVKAPKPLMNNMVTIEMI